MCSRIHGERCGHTCFKKASQTSVVDADVGENRTRLPTVQPEAVYMTATVTYHKKVWRSNLLVSWFL